MAITRELIEAEPADDSLPLPSAGGRSVRRAGGLAATCLAALVGAVVAFALQRPDPQTATNAAAPMPQLDPAAGAAMQTVDMPLGEFRITRMLDGFEAVEGPSEYVGGPPITAPASVQGCEFVTVQDPERPDLQQQIVTSCPGDTDGVPTTPDAPQATIQGFAISDGSAHYVISVRTGTVEGNGRLADRFRADGAREVQVDGHLYLVDDDFDYPGVGEPDVAVFSELDGGGNLQIHGQGVAGDDLVAVAAGVRAQGAQG